MLLLGGCAGSGASVRKKPLKDYEETFDPSKYRDRSDSDALTEDPSRNALPNTESHDEYFTINRVEQTMGFRVQIFSTTSIEDAEQRRDDYHEMLGDSVAVAIVFDAPYYKIRVGNYLAKGAAETECARLKELGLQEAWVVRDKVNRIITETVKKRE